jgi:hypothetical protein
MANRQEELLPILKALREYISKEYAVNYPPHVRGEDASNKELPASWQDKLDPITGGETTGRDTFGSSGQNATKAGSQSEDAYIHKSELEQILKDFVSKHYVDGMDVQQRGARGDNAGFAYPGEERRVPEGLEKHGSEMGKNEEEMNGIPGEEEEEEGLPAMEEAGEDELLAEDEVPVEEGEEEEEEMEGVAAGHMAYSKDNVNSLLKDIKSLLVQKQTERSEFGSLKSELDTIKKSMPSQIKQGVTAGMKRFNLNPSVSDQATRTRVPATSGSKPVANQPMPDKRIGVEGESFAKTDPEANWQAQEQFTNAVEQILGGNDADDIRGTFKKVNSMRNQSGELTPQTLYYYPRGGAK